MLISILNRQKARAISCTNFLLIRIISIRITLAAGFKIASPTFENSRWSVQSEPLSPVTNSDVINGRHMCPVTRP